MIIFYRLYAIYHTIKHVINYIITFYFSNCVFNHHIFNYYALKVETHHMKEVIYENVCTNEMRKK